MSNRFFEISKDIANEFLQSIVFIDDKAYANEGSNIHEFDAHQITKAFAKSNKICAVYKPETVQHIDDIVKLAKKADIIVVDWQLNIENNDEQIGREEDVEEDDPRGPYTRKIIRDILSDSFSGNAVLKLILIYTGEIGLYDIVEDVYSDLCGAGFKGFKKNDCVVFSNNIKIMVLAKPFSDGKDGDSKFKYNPKLNEKIVEYDDLPDFILSEFTKMTNGILSNFVLQSLTVLRKNTFSLISLYNKDLDSSFLVHRLLLPNQEDSKEQLIEFFSHSIQALLNYNDVGESVSSDSINAWIDRKNYDNLITISKKRIAVDNKFLKKLFTDGITSTVENYWSIKKFGQLARNTISDFEKKLKEDGSAFIDGDSASVSQDDRFSILTHHKSNLKQPSRIPRLSLGTVIMHKMPDGSKKYYVCIQAKCDSVRIDKERKFLFLPLSTTSDDKFHFVVEHDEKYVKLKSVKEPYLLKTIKFTPKVEPVIIAEKEIDGIYYFTSSYNEKYCWVCDLKDAHAQRIAQKYASQLSRVGLDESELLRRSSP